MSVHRPGKLHQINKPYKSKFRSKGALDRKAQGKVESRAPLKSMKKQVAGGKQERKLKAKQMEKKKREALWKEKRIGSLSSGSAPRLVVLVALSNKVDLGAIESLFLQSLEIDAPPRDPKQIGPTTISVPRWKSKLSLYSVKSRNLIATMDVVKTADMVVFVMDPQDVRDDLAFSTISIIKAQGQPSVIGVIQGLSAIPNPKTRNSLKKRATAFFHTEFLNKPRVLPIDTKDEAMQVLRFMSETNISQLTWRSMRPYMLVDKIDFKPSTTDSEFGTLLLSGYLRGNYLDPNNVIHITGYGDAQIDLVEGGIDPYDPKTNKNMETDSLQIIARSNPDTMETLVRENPPDPFAAEQTWPTPEELFESEKKVKKVPVGMSEYQAAWLPDEEDDNEEEGEDDFDVDFDEDQMEDFVDKEENKSLPNVEQEKDEKISNEVVMDDDEADSLDDEESGEDFMIQPAEAEKTLKEKDEEDLIWPDEVETPFDKLARIRFQKYRGLKSFRTSPWDSKENLPRDYSRIFQFQNFRRAIKRILKLRGSVEPNQYITIHIKNITATQFKEHPSDLPLIVSGLLRFENKISVINFRVHKTAAYNEPVKSKTHLQFHCGFRRFSGCPVFSEDSKNCDKFKYENFLRGTSIATLYAPICYPPTPLVLLDDRNELVGTGMLQSVDPDRLIVKKIILTGVPYKVKKRKAVVRNMFYTPEDIRWFRPVELWTKYGRSGKIMDSLGTHGRMKCMFDNTMSQQDTICMSLYKRTFPKWAEIPELKQPQTTSANTEEKIH